MSLPTEGEVFAQLMEHLRKCQEAAASLAHLTRDDNRLKAQGWMAVSEMFKKVQHQVIDLAKRKMH